MTSTIALMVKQMLELQDQVNTRINGQWRSAGNPWHRAIWTECAELLDHLGWKWWKKQIPNIPQVQLELIDIWHFGLSDILQHTENREQALNDLVAALSLFDHDLHEQDGRFRLTAGEVEAFAQSTLTEKRFNCELFAQIALAAQLSFAEIFRQYVGKNVLNRFRQDHGYSTGSYVKVWKGREDNEWLVEVSQALDSTSPDFGENIYAALSDCYAQIATI